MNEPAQPTTAGTAPYYEPQPRPAYPHPHAVPMAGDPRQKSPFLAGLLSVMPGLGQIYTGYYQRGFVHALVAGSLFALLAEGEDTPLMPLGVIFLTFFWFYNIIDASRRAALYNQALAGVADIELPEDFKVPAFRGSIIGGLVIAAAGVVLLLNTRFGVSLAWLEQWWPAALILFGGYLVWKAWQDRPRPASRLDDVG